MAKKNRHNAAFVAGAVIGGLAGAAMALWKTPYSGEELRAKIGGNAEPSADGRGDRTTTDSGRSMKDKVLSTVEHTLAPIVGVELGKTANDSGVAPGTGEETSSMGPGAGQRPGATSAPPGASFGSQSSGQPPAYPSDEPGLRADREGVPQENVSPVDREGGEPSDLSPSAGEGVSESDAATVEELTKPQTSAVPDAFQDADESQKKSFPKLGGTED